MAAGGAVAGAREAVVAGAVGAVVPVGAAVVAGGGAGVVAGGGAGVAAGSSSPPHPAAIRANAVITPIDALYLRNRVLILIGITFHTASPVV